MKYTHRYEVIPLIYANDVVFLKRCEIRSLENRCKVIALNSKDLVLVAKYIDIFKINLEYLLHILGYKEVGTIPSGNNTKDTA